MQGEGGLWIYAPDDSCTAIGRISGLVLRLPGYCVLIRRLSPRKRITLRNWQGRKQSRRGTMTNSRKLSDLEEQIRVQYVLDLYSRGSSPQLYGVEEMANRLLADRDMPSVGPQWASNFIKRQPELKTRFFRRYDYQRAKCEDSVVINTWFLPVKNTIAKYGSS